MSRLLSTSRSRVDSSSGSPGRSVRAEPPKINDVSPFGVKRGESRRGQHHRGEPRGQPPADRDVPVPGRGVASREEQGRGLGVQAERAGDGRAGGLSDPGADRRRASRTRSCSRSASFRRSPRRKTTARSRRPRRSRSSAGDRGAGRRGTTSITSSSQARRGRRSSSTPSARGSARASTRRSG